MDLRTKSVLTQNEIKSLFGEKAYAQAIEKYNEYGKMEIYNGSDTFEMRYIDEDLERDLIYYSLIPMGENTYEYIRQHSPIHTANS